MAVAAIAALELSFRDAEKADDPFLLHLYGTTHGQELRLLSLPALHLAAMTGMQFEAQRQAYRSQYPNSQRLLVLREGNPIGYLCFDMGPEELRILDIALLPEYQGRGCGTAIFTTLIDRARRLQIPLRLSVQRSNAEALRLYRRVGFVQRSQGPLSIEMEFRH